LASKSSTNILANNEIFILTPYFVINFGNEVVGVEYFVCHENTERLHDIFAFKLNNMKQDIQSRSDVKLLIEHFYSNVVNDDLIAIFFNEVASVNWEKHMPIMIGFWEFILFSTPNAYTGSVMTPHFHLHALKALQPQHFERWLHLFNRSVDELFEGVKAEDAKLAAQNIAATMKYKLMGSATKNIMTIEKID